jgi:acyl-CoA thioester hydrolase
MHKESFMTEFVKSFELRWSDVDANLHVMHSRYYELGAHCRMSFMFAHGVNTDLFRKEMFGPILFREECVFKKELHAGETVTVTLVVTKSKKDGSRWSAMHEIKKQNGTVAAVMYADLAWMDLKLRKLASPPAIIAKMIQDAPKHQDFVFEE